jgi:AcrR family transcriptional regulator
VFDPHVSECTKWFTRPATLFSVEDARSALLTRIVDDVAANGLGARSLRELAASVRSSHRMVLYHFGSREGLVSAIVERVEQSQRDLLRELAADTDDAGELIMRLWARVCAPQLRPFVRLFFEAAAARGVADARDDGLTAPWVDASTDAAELLGIEVDPAEIRLGVAVTRGLLLDVVASGEVEPATEALQLYVEQWRAKQRA